MNDSNIKSNDNIQIKNKESHPKKKRKKNKKFRKKNKYQKRFKISQSIAGERIDYLMKRAIEIYPFDSELADRYLNLVRNYSKAVKVAIPKKYKKLICHKCKKLMIPGYSCRNRIQSQKKRGSRLIITCLNCGHITHIYFKARNRDIENK